MHYSGPKLQFIESILGADVDANFNELAREAFNFQRENCQPYAEFLTLSVYPAYTEPPRFMPIELFKTLRVCTESHEEATFKSSGTTGLERSHHFVASLDLYRNNARKAFEKQFGSLKDVCILALLPSYLEQGDSSLVWMVQSFIEASGNADSSFIPFDALIARKRIHDVCVRHPRVILFGVSYALLDLAESMVFDLPGLSIFETGGMKGRKEELTRQELHSRIRAGFPASMIYSEYGMTELLSQAYSKDGHWFQPASTLKAYATSTSDPFEVLSYGRRGLLAFIDLANIFSCSFIQTRDIGVVREDGTFSVEGRLDHSDLRGCNLLYV